MIGRRRREIDYRIHACSEVEQGFPDAAAVSFIAYFSWSKLYDITPHTFCEEAKNTQRGHRGGSEGTGSHLQYCLCHHAT